MIRPLFDAPDLFSVSSAVILYKCIPYIPPVGYRCSFFLFFFSFFSLSLLSVLPYLWIGDGRFIFDYEIEINKCPSFSLFLSLSLSVFFLRVFEKVFLFFFSFRSVEIAL